MKNVKKTISVILIMIVTCMYVNTAFGTQVTEDNFYKTLKSLKKVVIKTWNADAPSYEESSMKSTVTRTYDEEIVNTSKGIDYCYSLDENSEKIKLFSTEYSIDSNVFKAKAHVEAEDIQQLIKDDEDALLYLGIIMTFSQLPTDYIMALAELTGVKPENAYGYYAENIGTENETDSRGIIKYNFINNDKYLDLDLEVDLEKFSKIDSTYLKGDYAYQITIEKRNVSDAKNENQVSDENENKDNDVNNVTNTINDKNENRNNSKNTNTNTNTNTKNNINKNTNRNTNTNTNTNRNVNKNNNTKKVDNNTNSKLDNTVSENKLPKAGIAKGGLVIISISIIGIYSYKKYIDYNKMF